MLNYYFLTTLKPLQKDMPLFMNTENLFNKASIFIDEITKNNLFYLMQYKNLYKNCLKYPNISEENKIFIESLNNGNNNFSINNIQINYWQNLANNKYSKILKFYGKNIFNLYNEISKFYTKEQIEITDKYIGNILECINLKESIKTQNLIDDYYWYVLEQYSSNDPFSWEELYIYFLKTQIIERKQSYSAYEGEKILFSLINKGSYASSN